MNAAYDVSSAVDGDPRAIDRLLASIRPLVVGYCRARLGRIEQTFRTADGVAHEVVLAVLTALPSFRDQGRPFLAFVYGIAAHKVSDAQQAPAEDREQVGTTSVETLLDRSSLGTEGAVVSRRRSVPHGLDTRAAVIVTGILRDHEMAAAHVRDPSDRMTGLLALLPEKQREILFLRVVVGLSSAETAEAIGSSPGAVQVAQHRALVRLREALAAEEVSSDGQATG